MRKSSSERFMTLAMITGTEIATFYSLWLLIGMYVVNVEPLLIAVELWLVSMIGGALSLWAGDRHRKRNKVTILILGLLLIIGVLFMRKEVTTSIIGVLLAGAAYRGVVLTTGSWMDRFSMRVHLAGIGMTTLLFIFSYKLPGISSVIHGLYLAGLISLAAWLLRRNAHHIRKASLTDEKLPLHLKGIVAVNRSWSLVIVALMIGMGAATFLGEALVWLWKMFTSWLREVLGSEVQEDTLPPEPMDTPPQQFPFFDEMPEQGADSTIWTQIIQIVVGVLVILALLFVAYRLLNSLVQGFRKLLQYWGKSGSEKIVKEEYVSYIDEVRRIPRKPRRPKLKKKGEVQPEETGGQIRYYYRQLIRKAVGDGFRYQSSYTPNEVGRELGEHHGSQQSKELSDEIIALYNESRYGQQEIAEQRVQDWQKKWKGRKN